ncbi:MAG: signal peptidase II [Actinomycetota bacterium]
MSVETRQAVARAAARRARRTLAERWRALGAVALAVLAVDQLTKAVVRATLAPGESRDVVPGFSITRARNEGIAFGLFPGRQAVVAVLTVIALCGITVAIVALMRRHRGVATGGGLLLGGSIGNLIDRLAHGGVTDFLDPARWPAFNLADVSIVVGAALIALGLVAPDADAGGRPHEDPPWAAR